MPTIYECLSQYCKERNIPLPRKYYRCQIGHLVLEQWQKQANGQQLPHQYQEEAGGTFRVLCYPSSFGPKIIEVIDHYMLALQNCRQNKGSLTLPEPFQNPSRTLPEPVRKASKSLPKPSNKGKITLQSTLDKATGTLHDGLRKGIIPLNNGYCNPPSSVPEGICIPSQYLPDSIRKGVDSLSDTIGILTVRDSEPIDKGNVNLANTLDNNPSIQRESLLKKLRKRIYRG